MTDLGGFGVVLWCSKNSFHSSPLLNQSTTKFSTSFSFTADFAK